MKALGWFGMGCAFAVLSVAMADKPLSKSEAASISVNAAEVRWGEAPPAFPKGGQMAVLHGDPTKNQMFALRLKLPDGYKIAPHWHTKDEQLTILSGTFILRMGDTMDAPAHTLSAGGFHFLPSKMHHAAQAKGDVIVEIHGMGPLDIHYLNPADDPSKKPRE